MIAIVGILGFKAYGSLAENSLQIPDVVAIVNGINITRQQLEDRIVQSRAMNPEVFDAIDLKQRKKAIIRTIDNMILREIIYQEAVRRDIVVTDEEVNLNLEELKKQFLSEEAFKKAFADAQITIDAWIKETKQNLMAMKLEDLMINELQITDKEIADYYEKNKKDQNLKDHKEHIRSILQQAKWQQLRPTWLRGLLINAKVWRWLP